VRYAGDHNDAYPTFREFLKMVQSQARKRNHPNVTTGVPTANSQAHNCYREKSKGKPFSKTGLDIRRVSKTPVAPANERVPANENTRTSKEKRCVFHNRMQSLRQFDFRRERRVVLRRETVFPLFFAGSHSQCM